MPDERKTAPMHWKRAWLLAVAVIVVVVSAITALAAAYGELNASWILAAVMTVIFLGAFAAVREYVLWRLLTKKRGS